MQDLPQFAEMPDSVRNIMKASIEQARKAFDAFIGASQKAISGMEGSSQATEGVKQLNEKIAEFTRLNADANFRLAMKLADAREIGDVLKIQNQHAQELMENFSKQLEELRELTMKLVKDSAQTAASMMPNMPGSN